MAQRSKKKTTAAPSVTTKASIAFQGELGANSHLACQEIFPDMHVLACETFDDAFTALQEGRAEFGMIPIENTAAGRVADIHHLLPDAGLYIVGEHFLRVHHNILAPKGAKLEDIKSVQSHTMALGQCRKIIRELGVKAVHAADTAGSAREIAEAGDPTRAAIAPSLAAEIYGLDILKANVEDTPHNTTRFLIMSREPDDADPEDKPVITSFIFRVRNVPAALYKAMGGFATNGVNMTKLESYQLEGSFQATQFYADVEGHPAERNVRLAFEELEFFSSYLRILGVYRAGAYRYEEPSETGS